MKIVIIGGVAGGATAAARVRRVDESAEITILEKGPYVSFANCGLPYFIGGEIKSRDALLLQTPKGFWDRYRIRVQTDSEVVEIKRGEKIVIYKDQSGTHEISFDRLLLSQGSSPLQLPGVSGSNVFSLRDVPDMDRIHQYIQTKDPKTAIVIGGGFIGLEMAEALAHKGMLVTVLERGPQIMPPLDPEFARQAQAELEKNGIKVYTSCELTKIENGGAHLTTNSSLKFDLLIVAAGVKPEAELAKNSGLKMGKTGGVEVDEFLFTSDPNILAVGDMAEINHKILNRKMRIALAGPANRQGRVAGVNLILGKKEKYLGSIASSVVKLFGKTSAQTGISEAFARRENIPVASATVHPRHHAGYYPGAQSLTLKVIFNLESGRILGAQAFGSEGVEKRIDVFAMAIHAEKSVHDLIGLDLCYAPPYSSANDPVNMASYVACNRLTGFSPSFSAQEALELIRSKEYEVLDVRDPSERQNGFIENSICIPLNKLRDEAATIDPQKKWIVHCAVGYRGHLAVRILLQKGFSKVWNLSGGYQSYSLLNT